MVGWLEKEVERGVSYECRSRVIGSARCKPLCEQVFAEQC